MDSTELIKYNLSNTSDSLYNNILIFGLQGAGVSSLINTFATAIQGPKTTSLVRSVSKQAYATSAPSKSRTTQQLSKTVLNTYLPQMKTFVWESWGISSLGEGNNYDGLELDLLMQGMLPDRFPMPKDPKAVMQVLSSGKKPDHYCTVHGIGFVMSQTSIVHLQSSELTKIKNILKQCRDRGRVPILIITKVDLLLESIELTAETSIDDLNQCKDIRKLASELLEVSLDDVHCMISYNNVKHDKAGKRVPAIDRQCIQILKLILRQCRDFQETDPSTLTLIRKHVPQFGIQRSNGTLSNQASMSYLNLRKDQSEFSSTNVMKEEKQPTKSEEKVPEDAEAFLDESNTSNTGGLMFSDIISQVKQEIKMDIPVEKPVDPLPYQKPDIASADQSQNSTERIDHQEGEGSTTDQKIHACLPSLGQTLNSPKTDVHDSNQNPDSKSLSSVNDGNQSNITPGISKAEDAGSIQALRETAQPLNVHHSSGMKQKEQSSENSVIAKELSQTNTESSKAQEPRQVPVSPNAQGSIKNVSSPKAQEDTIQKTLSNPKVLETLTNVDVKKEPASPKGKSMQDLASHKEITQLQSLTTQNSLKNMRESGQNTTLSSPIMEISLRNLASAKETTPNAPLPSPKAQGSTHNLATSQKPEEAGTPAIPQYSSNTSQLSPKVQDCSQNKPPIASKTQIKTVTKLEEALADALTNSPKSATQSRPGTHSAKSATDNLKRDPKFLKGKDLVNVSNKSLSGDISSNLIISHQSESIDITVSGNPLEDSVNGGLASASTIAGSKLALEESNVSLNRTLPISVSANDQFSLSDTYDQFRVSSNSRKSVTDSMKKSNPQIQRIQTDTKTLPSPADITDQKISAITKTPSTPKMNEPVMDQSRKALESALSPLVRPETSKEKSQTKQDVSLNDTVETTAMQHTETKSNPATQQSEIPVSMDSRKSSVQIETKDSTQPRSVPSSESNTALDRLAQRSTANYSAVSPSTPKHGTEMKPCKENLIDLTSPILKDMTSQTPQQTKITTNVSSKYAAESLPTPVSAGQNDQGGRQLVMRVQVLETNYDRFVHDLSGLRSKVDLVEELSLKVNEVQASIGNLTQIQPPSSEHKRDKHNLDSLDNRVQLIETHLEGIAELVSRIETERSKSEINSAQNYFTQKTRIDDRWEDILEQLNELSVRLYSVEEKLFPVTIEDPLSITQSTQATAVNPLHNVEGKNDTLANLATSPAVISELFATNDILRDEIRDLTKKINKLQSEAEAAHQKAQDAETAAKLAQEKAGRCQCTIL